MIELSCPKCSNRMELKELQKQKTFRGIDIDYACKAYVCAKCGMEAGTVQTAGEVQRAVADAYRARAGLLTGREIKALREAKGLTQKELAADVQVGIASIKRWETGAVQSEAMDKLLRMHLQEDKRRCSTNGNREMDLPRIKIVAETLEGILGRELLKEGDKFLFLAKYLWYADMFAFKKLGRGLTGASYASMPYGPQLNNYKDLLDHIKASDVNEAEPLTDEELGIVRQIAKRFPEDRDAFDAAHSEKVWINSRIGSLIPYASAYELTEIP